MTGMLITVGEILVEVMATTVGTGFANRRASIGPFPSGAPAIFIDQAARLGARCAMIGAVGDDDFGRVNIDRLSADGVDVSAIAMHAGSRRARRSCAIAPTEAEISCSTSGTARAAGSR